MGKFTSGILQLLIIFNLCNYSSCLVSNPCAWWTSFFLCWKFPIGFAMRWLTCFARQWALGEYYYILPHISLIFALLVVFKNDEWLFTVSVWSSNSLTIAMPYARPQVPLVSAPNTAFLDIPWWPRTHWEVAVIPNEISTCLHWK